MLDIFLIFLAGKQKSTFDPTFLQTVFSDRTSVRRHKLNPLLSESQTEVELTSRVGRPTPTSRVPFFYKPGCSTSTSQSCRVPLLPVRYSLYLTDLNPFFPCQDSLHSYLICTLASSRAPTWCSAYIRCVLKPKLKSYYIEVDCWHVGTQRYDSVC